MQNIIKTTLLTLSILLAPSLSKFANRKYIYDYKGSSVVYLRGSRSGGTGFVVRNHKGRKYTMTNAHICRLKDKDGFLQYETEEGKKGKVKVLEMYELHDLCVTEPVEDLPALSVAKYLDKHESVWLIGHPGLRPLTLENGYFIDYTDINVSGACKKIKVDSVLDKILKQYRLNYCTNKYKAGYVNTISYGGNSGSPVLNKWGNVIGVLFAGARSQNTSSYIVPIWHVKKFLNKTRK
jgi:S1-C subfamily serine protease